MAPESVFLDTNIVADMIDAERERHIDSVRLLESLVKRQVRIVISEDMITTLFYISQDKKATLEFLLHVVYPLWSVVPYGMVLIREATDTALREKSDLEDTLQCLCAKNERCAIVITEDQGFVECGVRVMDYDAALREFEAR